jgi:transporter family protein
MNWAAAAFFSLCSYGLWGLFTKLSVMHIDSKSAIVFQSIGSVLISVIVLSTLDYKLETNLKGVSFAVLTGIVGGIGGLFYLIAVSKGKITTVVTLTALYPLITILLAYWLLKETVSLKQCLGIGLGMIAILLMST